MCLAPPWKPIECMVKLPETPDHTIDKWGFATTISEISSWCQESDTRMGYPEESSNLRMVFRIIECQLAVGNKKWIFFDLKNSLL